MTKARSRSPRDRAHMEGGIGFKSGTSLLKSGVCDLCGEVYEVDNLCPSCVNLRIRRIAYSVIMKMLLDGTLYKILTKGEEAIPTFEDYFDLRDIYSEEEKE